MLQKVFSKSTTMYAVIGVIVVIIIALVVVYFLVFAASTVELELKASLSAKLEDSNIKSNETTYLLVGAKNSGTQLLEAEFRITPDDAEAVVIEYDKPEFLKLGLLPQESVVRRLKVTGFSKAIRTDYEIQIELVGNNETILETETVLLTVRK